MSLCVSAYTHRIITEYLLATRYRDVRTLKMRCLPQNVVAEVKFDIPHKSQLCGSARTDGDVLRYRDRHAPITSAWRRQAPISLRSTTSFPFVSGKPLHCTSTSSSPSAVAPGDIPEPSHPCSASSDIATSSSSQSQHQTPNTQKSRYSARPRYAS